MKRTKPDIIFDTVNITIISLLLVVILYPLYFIIIASVSDPNLIYSGDILFLPKGINIEAYKLIFTDKMIWTGYLNTIVYTAVGTVLSTAITLPMSYAVSRKDFGWWGVYILWAGLFTMFFKGGLIPEYLLVRNLGMINTRWAIILPLSVGVWQLIIARTFFRSTIPDDLLDAARIDGSDDFTFFLRIVIPTSQAVIAIIVLFYAVQYWNDYFQALIYIRDEKLYPLQLVLRNILIQNQLSPQMVTDVETMAAKQILGNLMKYGVIIVGSVPLLILYPFLQRYFVKGIMMGSIKG